MNPRLVASDHAAGWHLWQGDAVLTLEQLSLGGLDGMVDLVFADPPYFVDKAPWDTRRSLDESHAFHHQWMAACLPLLAPTGSLWVCGGDHSSPVVGFVAQELGLRIVNTITWEKPNPPPVFHRQCFVKATETLFWLAPEGTKPTFNYGCMRAANGGRQMRSHWRMAKPRDHERRHGKHPSQKPEPLVERCLLATSKPGDLVLDPFAGSGTTAVAAVRHGRRIIGIDSCRSYLAIAERRLGDELRSLAVSTEASAS